MVENSKECVYRRENHIKQDEADVFKFFILTEAI
jgi:hypothetical protein